MKKRRNCNRGFSVFLYPALGGALVFDAPCRAGVVFAA